MRSSGTACARSPTRQPGQLRLQQPQPARHHRAAIPRCVALNRALGSRTAVLDGELVAFDARGSAQLRAPAAAHAPRLATSAVRRAHRDPPVVYVVFDLLYLDGHSLMTLPYAERRERLEELALDGPAWRTPAAHRGDGAALLAASAEQGLEGLVAKRLDSRYEPGRRIGVLDQGQEQPPPGARGRWLAAGRGTAPSSASARCCSATTSPTARCATPGAWGRASPRRRSRCCPAPAPLRRRGQPVRRTGACRRARSSVEPELVAEVEFTEWTAAGLLRHPSYKGLRDDKAPADVVREDPRRPRPGSATRPRAGRRSRPLMKCSSSCPRTAARCSSRAAG